MAEEFYVPPHLRVDPSKASLPEVQAELKRRGIDLTGAMRRVKAAVASAKRRMDSGCDGPCAVDSGCEVCEEYWQRMRDEGLWIDGTGWTERAFRTM